MCDEYVYSAHVWTISVVTKATYSDQKVHARAQAESHGKRLCRDGRGPAFRIVLFGRRLLGFLDGLNGAISFILNFLRLCP